ncbi:MAG: arsenate reductase (glutaredoxin) [Rhodospirillaceae bacterium]|nr:arsenate reductase (glutaredoxin) [Rhodospirillaceae bacterium]
MMTVTIYHNPRCSKSRQTLALLIDNGIKPKIVEYLNRPPTQKELSRILRLLNLAPRDLMRKKESEYKSMGLDNLNLDDSSLIAAMISHPILMERPIVTTENNAAIGRPPENVLSII